MAKSRPNPKRKKSKQARSYSDRVYSDKIGYLHPGWNSRQLQLMNIEIHGEPVKKPDPKVEPLLRRSLSWLDMMKQIIPDDPNIPALELRVRPSLKALLRTILRR